MEDRKLVKLFTRQGAEFGVITRMPYKEIEQELYSTERDPDWIILEGRDQTDDNVGVRVSRHEFVAGFIFSSPPKVVVTPPKPGLIQ